MSPIALAVAITVRVGVHGVVWASGHSRRRSLIGLHDLFNPPQCLMDSSPNSWVFLACAAFAPRGSPVNCVSTWTRLAHQRTAAVTLASVPDLAIRPSTLRTKHVIRDLAGIVSCGPAVTQAKSVNLSLLEDFGGDSTRSESSPTCDPALCLRWDITALRREANRTDTVGHVEGRLHADQSEVIVGCLAVVGRMPEHLHCPATLLVSIWSLSVVAPSNYIEIWLANTVRCSQYPLRVDELPSAERSRSLTGSNTNLPPPFALGCRRSIHNRDVDIGI